MAQSLIKEPVCKDELSHKAEVLLRAMLLKVLIENVEQKIKKIERMRQCLRNGR